MAFFRRNKSPFPLAKTANASMTDEKTFQALDMVVQASHQGAGGLYLVMQKPKDKTMNLVHLDTLLSSQTGKPYTASRCNEDILNSIKHIKLAAGNPSLYGMDDRQKELNGHLVLAAIATPVDVAGIVTTDADAYGWEIAGFSANNYMDLDVFAQGGEPVSGTLDSFTDLWLEQAQERMNETTKKYFDVMVVGLVRRHYLFPLIQTMLGHKVEEKHMDRLERSV